MKAILLCAGFATRLYPLTRDHAKPLLPVAGRPVLSHLVEQIAATASFGEIVVVANRRFYRDFEEWAVELEPEVPDVVLRVLDNGATANENRRGAVGDLAFAVGSMKLNDPTLVAAGDNLFRFPLGELIDDFESAPRNLVVVHRETDRGRLRRTGVVELDESEQRIVRFREKPQEPASNVCATPLYLFEPGSLSLVRELAAADPEADAPGTFIAWLVQRRAVYVHPMRGKRLDLGDLETYRRAEAWLRS